VTVLRRKDVDLQAWHLTDLSAMAEAFSVVTAEGWRGGISSGNGSELRLELNRDDPQGQIVAGIGDWLILDMGVRLLTDEEFAENYDEVEPGS
jgi:hypothetical protein